MRGGVAASLGLRQRRGLLGRQVLVVAVLRLPKPSVYNTSSINNGRWLG